MNKRSLFLSLTLLVGLSVSCKKSSDPAANTACTQANLNARVDAYSAALTTYSTNPSKANCNAVVVAYDNYLAVAQNCSFVTAQQVSAIQQARADLAKSCQ